MTDSENRSLLLQLLKNSAAHERQRDAMLLLRLQQKLQLQGSSLSIDERFLLCQLALDRRSESTGSQHEDKP